MRPIVLFTILDAIVKAALFVVAAAMAIALTALVAVLLIWGVRLL